MKEYLTKRFSIFHNNSQLAIIGLYDFIKDVNDHLISNGKIIVSPQQKDITITWAVRRRTDDSKNLKFSCQKWRYVFFDFRNFLLLYLRRYHVIVILFNNYTGQIVDGTEIAELWGYRMILLDNTVFLQTISHQELFDSSTKNPLDNSITPPNQSIIYCGPEGRIHGWDNIS